MSTPHYLVNIAAGIGAKLLDQFLDTTELAFGRF
jgi:hypothetical protein